MSTSISGRIFQILEQQSGNGQNGPWKKQVFIVETEGQYPKKVAFEAWNDKAQEIQESAPGDKVTISYNLESKEYNGKWYTTAKVWKIERDYNSAPRQQQQPAAENTNSTPPAEMKDDLPF
jgi:hypothetical protein